MLRKIEVFPISRPTSCCAFQHNLHAFFFITQKQARTKSCSIYGIHLQRVMIVLAKLGLLCTSQPSNYSRNSAMFALLLVSICSWHRCAYSIALMRVFPEVIVLTTKSHFHVKRMYASIRGLVVRTITSGKTRISAIERCLLTNYTCIWQNIYDKLPFRDKSPHRLLESQRLSKIRITSFCYRQSLSQGVLTSLVVVFRPYLYLAVSSIL